MICYYLCAGLFGLQHPRDCRKKESVYMHCGQTPGKLAELQAAGADEGQGADFDTRALEEKQDRPGSTARPPKNSSGQGKEGCSLHR